MPRLVLVAAAAVVAALTAPASALVTICPGGVTVTVGDTSVGQQFDCVSV